MGLGDTGISPSYKVPRFLAKLIFGAGAVSAGNDRLRLLLVGMKTSGGTLVADGSPQRCFSTDEADTLAGPGSQLAMQAYSALTVDSIELWLAAVTEPGGGTAATATLVLSGTNTVGGTLYFRLAGKTIIVNVSPLNILDDIGAAIVAAGTAKTRLPATWAYNSGTKTVTATTKNKGIGGKDWILYWDTTNAPPGLIITMTGSAAVNTNGVRFGASSTGTGSEDVTTLLTKLMTKRWARIAPAHNDATNAALWEAQVNSKAGPTSLLLEQLVFAHNGSLASAQSIAQTTLNAFRAQLLWFRNSENHPCEVAARKAAYRSVLEQTTWVPDYDGFNLNLAVQAFDSDIATDTEQDTALNNGVTPVVTNGDQTQVVRSITSYCLNGSAQDERCLDIGDAVAPDQITLDLQSTWSTFRAANPYVGPDPAVGEDPPPEKVAFPALWASKVSERLQVHYDAGWLEERPVGIWAPKYTYVKSGKYIAGDTPLAIRRVNHRVDNVIRQTANLV